VESRPSTAGMRVVYPPLSVIDENSSRYEEGIPADSHNEILAIPIPGQPLHNLEPTGSLTQGGNLFLRAKIPSTRTSNSMTTTVSNVGFTVDGDHTLKSSLYTCCTSRSCKGDRSAMEGTTNCAVCPITHRIFTHTFRTLCSLQAHVSEATD
jgi:hypothetical protein